MNIFESVIVASLDLKSFLICSAASVILGFFTALTYTVKNPRYSKSFVLSLALLPLIVQMIISMVNGNIGVGVAVAGTFSLVRFRSAAGSAKEITGVFVCMAAGLATGMGYVAVAAVFTVIVLALNLLYTVIGLGNGKKGEKILKITVPESLDYTGIFDDLFAEYTVRCVLEKVKLKNLGSLYQLTYRMTVKDISREKEFIDNIRCRNGNLEISCSSAALEAEEGL